MPRLYAEIRPRDLALAVGVQTRSRKASLGLVLAPLTCVVVGSVVRPFVGVEALGVGWMGFTPYIGRRTFVV